MYESTSFPDIDEIEVLIGFYSHSGGKPVKEKDNRIQRESNGETPPLFLTRSSKS